jgi:nucleotide-binding universal stress UspA family protein
VIEKVLIGVDDRQGSVDAIALARQLAAAKAEFTLAHVCNVGPGPGAVMVLMLASALDAAQTLLERRRDEASIDAQLVVTVALSIGEGLRSIAEERGADLLVVGSCHRGALGRILLGDDASATLHNAPCPVAVAPRGYAQAGRDATGLSEEPQIVAARED